MTDYALTEAEKAKFDRQGFLGPFKLFEREEALEIWKKKIRPKLMQRDGAVFPGSLLNYDRHLDIPELQEIVTSPKVVDRLRSILGEEILCWRTEWFAKYPGDAGTEWHQAKKFFEFEGQPKLQPDRATEEANEYWVLTVWIAFTDITRETSCMRFMPGSHKEDWYFDESKDGAFDADSADHKGFFGYSWEDLKYNKDWKPDEAKAVDMEVEAGEFFFFTSKCLHGSFPNSSPDRSRFAMSARYVLPEVHVYKDLERFKALNEVLELDKYRPLLVSGTGKSSVNRFKTPDLISDDARITGLPA
ncbi:chlorinating enzyme [Methylobacterium sp. SyP6R]|uniref:chlorinating enzyme n=1 Tax=Methylobacterium sp. SyP6R TaxID=2718876 RepID=UPI001F3A6FB0|nr:chlorinating enzyme [Methylobacterium sp. SyP6R]MCF4130027.1 chlorinating enzyme [Methylobacterium sp. SyP6R]